MALIELNNLTKTYSMGKHMVVALDGLDLTIEQGEFTVLAGPSGSGKTTTLNMIGALDVPTSGRVCVAGQSLVDESAKSLAQFRLHKIGFIFQSYNLIPVLTAAENAEFTLMLQGVEKSERRRKVTELFTELGIDGLEDRRPSDLSGGQQQRVAIVRAMVSKPAVILADEPTANLDSHASEDLLNLMRQLNEQRGTTFVFSSHDPQVINLARRVVRLRDGFLEADECFA